jgi:hypothetical protein
MICTLLAGFCLSSKEGIYHYNHRLVFLSNFGNCPSVTQEKCDRCLSPVTEWTNKVDLCYYFVEKIAIAEVADAEGAVAEAERRD